MTDSSKGYGNICKTLFDLYGINLMDVVLGTFEKNLENVRTISVCTRSRSDHTAYRRKFSTRA